MSLTPSPSAWSSAVIFDQHGVINYIFNTPEYRLDLWCHSGYGYGSSMHYTSCMEQYSFQDSWFSLSGLQGIDKQYYQAAEIDSLQ
jgi:hypothetical protein